MIYCRYNYELLYDDSFIKNCFVYGWCRQNKYIYIGMTTIGRNRLLSHHVIKKHKVRKTDHLDIWFCRNAREAAELEDKLIREHFPTLNKVFGNGKRKLREPEVIRETRPIPYELLTQCRTRKEHNELIRRYST